MRSMKVHRALALAAGLAASTLAGCGGDDRPAEVAAGQVGPSSTTTAEIAPGGDPGPSPVDGLDAAQLREAVTAPPTPASRARPGPVAERVTLADGRTVWRVRIPGSFTLRSAQARISVAGRDLGVAASPPSLDSLVAVTIGDEGLLDGAPVTYRWGTEDPIAAGALAVVR